MARDPARGAGWGDMKHCWLEFLTARDGEAAIEYALIAALLAVAAISGVHALGSKMTTHYQYLSNAIN
jgi:Flp pilus assembly pilin Flp